MVLLMIKTFVILLAFVSLATGNRQKENSNDPPCFFNPLCICSKAYPDLGRVTCKNIPLLSIPQQINTSKVFTLHLENNGLRYIKPHFFTNTGLFKIEISQNFLMEISEETFTGLERSLWELNLRNNRFKRVPNQSFRYMQKLKTLDLSGNEITTIRGEDWLGLEDTLKTLILNNNKISILYPRAFSNCEELETLDLRGNSLFELDAFSFKDGPRLLNELSLADNLLSAIPFQELSDLRKLRHLDLSFNLITEIQDLNVDKNKKKPVTLYLDTLSLDYNQIQYLPAESFRYFPLLNRTRLNGNPISYIEDCEITELTVDAFSGLEDHLEVLDLEGNNLTTLPLYFFKDFDFLKALNLKDNFFKEIDSEKMFEGFQPTLQHLDLRGEQNSVVSFRNFEKLHNIRSVAVSKLFQPVISEESFPEVIKNLEEIKISFGGIKRIQSHAFKNVRALRKLDLSSNSIADIENEAFAEIGHSLLYLSLANGLSTTWNQLPPYIFEDLTSLEFLDLSNNGLKVLPPQLFYSMKRLKILQIQDNLIELIPKRVFQADIHSELSTIQFSFNQLSSIESKSFIGLNKLEYLWLNDNRITTLEKRSFMNLNRLKYLFLRGNKINLVKEESFQDLPALEMLDLAYNNLKKFDFVCLEHVGTLSSFILNLSQNSIEQLITNLSLTDYPSFAVMNVNVKEMDLSHNNISLIGPRFFKPIESSVTHLYLSHNRIRNISKSVYGNMIHLQWLDLSFNLINDLEYDSFFNTKSIQVLYLSNNQLQEIPKHFFKGFNKLRVLNLETNEFRSFPDELFNDGNIEKLDISNNRLTKMPVNAFDVDSAAVLSELDLSKNAIVALPTADVLAIFKNLDWLDLSSNRIIWIENGLFSILTRLRVLNLSHNAELTLDPKGQTFNGLEDTLEDLVLKNLSLNEIPGPGLASLRSLDVADNQINDVPFEFSYNLPNLQKIEFEGNKLVAVPPAINALSKLQYLGMAENPLRSINFEQSFSLREVDLRNVSLSVIEKGVFGKMPFLENLKLSMTQRNQDLSLPQLLKHNYGLKQLYIEDIGDEMNIGDKMSGSFSPKLRNLTLVGHNLKTIPRNLLQGIQSPYINLVLFNTSVREITKDVFENGKKVRNLTLDVRSNRLMTMQNPNTGEVPNTPKSLFLTELHLSKNDWMCDCSIGWIEGWERRRRHYLCEENSPECLLVSNDFREAVCSNRKPITILEIFKAELECGWNSSEGLKTSSFFQFFIAAAVFWAFNV